jgi:hypothetical protein
LAATQVVALAAGKLSNDSRSSLPARKVALNPRGGSSLRTRFTTSSIVLLSDVMGCGRALPVSVASNFAAVLEPSYTRKYS